MAWDLFEDICLLGWSDDENLDIDHESIPQSAMNEKNLPNIKVPRLVWLICDEIET
jgi:hypothetical protein